MDLGSLWKIINVDSGLKSSSTSGIKYHFRYVSKTMYKICIMYMYVCMYVCVCMYVYVCNMYVKNMYKNCHFMSSSENHIKPKFQVKK